MFRSCALDAMEAGRG